MSDDWLKRGEPEWSRAWAAVATAFGDTECANPESGERWQYMGTYKGKHQFRHRDLGDRGRVMFSVKDERSAGA